MIEGFLCSVISFFFSFLFSFLFLSRMLFLIESHINMCMYAFSLWFAESECLFQVIVTMYM